MDQVKDFLRACVKHRFWIAVGVSALVPLIGYFVGSGTIKAEAATKTASIEGAYKDVQPFASDNNPINGQYKVAAAKVFEPLAKNVEGTWRALYERQAPLLRFPDVVHDKLVHWGRQQPDLKKEQITEADLAVILNQYTLAYPEYVQKSVYERFNPFNYETGKGVVDGPPRDLLLHPVAWDEEKIGKLKLSQVWAAQEKLWIQSALLQVIAEVNRGAKSWDEAAVRSVNAMEVATEVAQDQVSMAKATALTDIAFPGEPAEEAAATGATGMESGYESAMAGAMGGRGGAMDMGTLDSGSGGMGGAAAALKDTPDAIRYVDSGTEMFQIVPVYMSVLVKQEKVIDFLCALENSPMEIQVLEYEQSKPRQRVQKPEKGEAATNFSGYAGMAGMGGRGGGMMDMGSMMGGGSAYGGMMESMGGMSGLGGMSGRGGGMMDMGTNPYGGMMSGMGGNAAAKAAVGKGQDLRNEDAKKKREEMLKEFEKKSQRPSLFDPYFDIVQVSVYGQARFYRKPPDPVVDESANPTEVATETPKVEEPKADAPATDEPKTDEPKADEPKADEPKADAPATATEEPKVDAPKAEEPKAEEPKAEEPKADAPKAEEPKTEAPATDEPKPAP